MGRAVSGLQSLLQNGANARLPELRQDLEILRSGTTRDGAPAWVIYDPVQHRYFQINHEARELLSVWKDGATVAEWLMAAGLRLDLAIGEPAALALLDFLRKSHLTLDTADGRWRTLWSEAETSKHSLLMQLVHNYLFFRIKLFNPQRMLTAAMPYVAPLYSRRATALVLFTGLIGLYLVSRQWTQFTTTFQGYLSGEGAIYFTVSLVLVKALHELGHAFTAVRYGCQVPAIGVAFIVMAPLLYTDVTDSWRLSNRRHRLLIDAAGVIVELGLACIATFMWVFLPDGPVRSIAFVIATTSWITSIVLNLSPFTRFDAYYLLSDLLQVDNLQTRAFAIGRWRLRQILFAPLLRPPETFAPRLTNILIVYSWVVWIYRAIVFTGIAVLVYHYFFKTLGIILFAIEIWFFIARPIVAELLAWPKLGLANIQKSRTALTGALASAALLALVVPWSTSIEVPAMLIDANTANVYPVHAAVVESVEVKTGQAVERGQVLARLMSPELDSAIRSAGIEIGLTRARLARVPGDQEDKAQSLILSDALKSQTAKLEGFEKEREQLIVRAPVSGTVASLMAHIQNGQWLQKTDLIAVITGNKSLVARGYLAEHALQRTAEGAAGRFIPDDLTMPSAGVTLRTIALAGATSIEIAELASVYGGRVAVEPDAAQKLTPVTAQYLAEFDTEPSAAFPRQAVRGVVHLKGTPESYATAAWRQVARVLIRESGF